MVIAGSLLLALAILWAWFPRVLVYPLVVILVWIALSLFYRGYRLTRSKIREDWLTTRKQMLSKRNKDDRRYIPSRASCAV